MLRCKEYHLWKHGYIDEEDAEGRRAKWMYAKPVLTSSRGLKVQGSHETLPYLF